jgi:hypothetical protein
MSEDLLIRERVRDLHDIAAQIDVVANKWPGGPVSVLRRIADAIRSIADLRETEQVGEETTWQ